MLCVLQDNERLAQAGQAHLTPDVKCVDQLLAELVLCNEEDTVQTQLLGPNLCSTSCDQFHGASMLPEYLTAQSRRDTFLETLQAATMEYDILQRGRHVEPKLCHPQDVRCFQQGMMRQETKSPSHRTRILSTTSEEITIIDLSVQDVRRQTSRPNTAGGSREAVETEELSNQAKSTRTVSETWMSHVETRNRPETKRHEFLPPTLVRPCESHKKQGNKT